MSKKPVALIILDGFGYNPNDYGNAITAAKTPNIDKIFATYPNTKIGLKSVTQHAQLRNEFQSKRVR